jgi:hypothetical protein
VLARKLFELLLSMRLLLLLLLLLLCEEGSTISTELLLTHGVLKELSNAMQLKTHCCPKLVYRLLKV